MKRMYDHRNKKSSNNDGKALAFDQVKIELHTISEKGNELKYQFAGFVILITGLNSVYKPIEYYQNGF